MPNRYSDVMRIFSKIYKPVLVYPRQEEHLPVILFDDSCLQGDTEEEQMNNIKTITELLLKLRLLLHDEKSALMFNLF